MPTPKEIAYTTIAQLIEKFEEHADSYTKSDYNETLTRKDFIDPFFKALGWDINNELGYAESFREVIHEDKIRIEGKSKAPDYSFRLGGGKKLFFVEARKPRKKQGIMNIEQGIMNNEIKKVIKLNEKSSEILYFIVSYLQNSLFLVRYSIFNSNFKRYGYNKDKDYLKEFDFLWDTFSKERVPHGSLDKRA